MEDETPKQVSEAGLDAWYAGLSSQDRVRTRRCLDGICTSSDIGFLNDLMAKAAEDSNYKLAVTAGRYIDGMELSDIDRFDSTERYIEGLFGSDCYDEAKAMCLRNLDLYPKVRSVVEGRNGGVPKAMSCRNRLIDILVGVEGSYDEAFDVLDRYLEMGLIDEEELAYRKQSLKVHRMQRSFDNIFSYRKKAE